MNVIPNRMSALLYFVYFLPYIGSHSSTDRPNLAMSSTERSAWIRIGSMLIVFVPYFLHVLRLFHEDGPIGRQICVAFLVAALAHGVLNAIGQSALVLIFGKPMRDERDAAIDAVSLRISYFTLISLVIGALSTIAFLGAITRPSATGGILLPAFALTSQYVFFSFVVAEALRHVTQVVCYRREALE